MSLATLPTSPIGWLSWLSTTKNRDVDTLAAIRVTRERTSPLSINHALLVLAADMIEATTEEPFRVRDADHVAGILFASSAIDRVIRKGYLTESRDKGSHYRQLRITQEGREIAAAIGHSMALMIGRICKAAAR